MIFGSAFKPALLGDAVTAVGKVKSTRLAVDEDAVLSLRSTPVPVWACCGCGEVRESVGALEASEDVEEGLGREAVAVAGSQSVPVIETTYCKGLKMK